MSEGNGVELAAIYGAIMALDRKLNGLTGEVAKVRVENAQVRADLAALRSEVATYHAAVVGHGILISELDERLSRLERGEPPRAA